MPAEDKDDEIRNHTLVNVGATCLVSIRAVEFVVMHGSTLVQHAS